MWEDVVEEVLHGVNPPKVAMEMDDPARNHTHHGRYLIHAAVGGDSGMMVGMDTAKPHPQRCHLLQNSHVKPAKCTSFLARKHVKIFHQAPDPSDHTHGLIERHYIHKCEN